ncbi:Git3 domain-containing protein [Phanerochaete sordida]|uniref:Git3 domain-containing protein n=1 Tax=Phanerochaete sordida TaxID=48140 RepID=A0A9P3GHS1_9APHY|nr:Git3 domain-containing protein [Phanerochaete sordida]
MTNSSTVRLPNGHDLLVYMPVGGGEAHGLVVLVAASSVSLVAVVTLLGAISISAWNTRRSVNPHMFVRSHAAAYLVSLLFCDFLQAIGSLMNAKWVNEKGVTFMPFCQAQGAIKQLADVGTAIWAFVIAMHTFWVLFLGWDLRRYVLITTIVFNWSAIAAFVIAGPATLNVKQHGPFYGISGYWCWISDQYPGARIALDYMFMFASAFLSFVLYSLIFLKIRGNILVAGWRWRFRVHHSTDSARGLSADDQSVAVAKQMLLYPVAYTCIILPIAIARFADWAGAEVPFAATVFTDCVYLLSGLINVSLFFLTRRVLPRHSIITKRFTDDPEPDDSFEAGGRSPVGDVPGSYMAEKMDDTFFEDDASEHEKVFKQVGSPDSEPVPDDDEVPPITIVTDVHDAEDPHTPHGQRHAHRPIESGAGHPHSPMEDEPVIAPDSAIASSPGSFSAVSLDSAYTSSARRADFPASSGGPIAYPQSPLAVPGQNIPKTPLSPMARSPSRSEALRSNLGL